MASDADGAGASAGKNLEDDVGAGDDGGAVVEAVGGAVAAWAAGALDLGFVKKLRMSMT